MFTFIAVSLSLKNRIEELLMETKVFNANDVLVRLDKENKNLFFVTLGENLKFKIDHFPKRILRDTKKTQKESGVNSLCLAEGTIDINSENTETPLFLYPLSYKVDRINQEVQFSFEEEELFINPYILDFLENSSDVEFSLENGKEQLLGLLSETGIKIKSEETRVIGNFHHHRFQIIKELEELKSIDNYSPNLKSLFGEERVERINLDLPNDNLFSADLDHESVFESVKNDNCVIQGPPGTGKSQVLTNVIAKLLHSDKTSIVVSEKHVALAVLVKKLSEFSLDKYCFIASSDYLSHTFLQSLKATWDHLDNYEIVPVNNLKLSEQYQDGLQLTLNLLAHEKLIGGVSFSTFFKEYEQLELIDAEYSSSVLEVSDFLELEASINEVYKKHLSSTLGRFKSTALKTENLSLFDGKINAWLAQLNTLKKSCEFSSWSDFDTLKKEAAICQIFNNDLYKKYNEIFKTGSTQHKRFLSLRKKYLKARIQLEVIQKNQTQWIIVPSESETNSLLSRLKGITFFTKRKLKKRWHEISKMPFIEAEKELLKHKKQIATINSFSQISIDFCEFGIENVEIDVPQIFQTLTYYSEEEWQKINNFPDERKQFLRDSHTHLRELHQVLNQVFRFEKSTDINEFLKQLINKLPALISVKLISENFSDLALSSLLRNGSAEKFKGELFKSHLVRFKEKYPALSSFKISDIKEKVSTIISAQKQEAILFAKSIENGQKKRFDFYTELLTIPARKLSESDKQLKARLRKGKSLLIKEFSKTRSHPSLRELYNSEAREWIQLLKPIWLSNPTQLAKCFPMEENIFDVAIFDEASQIPLQNALGVIQRSNRVVVAGDQHQMGPTYYFKTGTSEVIDLLHQGNYNWKKTSLSHHYRSVNPDLIAFSNKHFYNGELKVYPSAEQLNPINYHYCEGGIFDNRENLIEAEAIAKHINEFAKKHLSIGVVAFSEQQLTCIWGKLSPVSQAFLSEENDGFFKSLENVQGDECDILLISFAYSKNSDGEFHMRFGPMNAVNGRNRLNVLLTRAKKSIHFFCSVKSSEFKLSDNESVNLLKKWLLFCENYKTSDKVSFPFGLKPIIENQKLTLTNVQETFQQAEELVTLQNVMENRSWEIEYN